MVRLLSTLMVVAALSACDMVGHMKETIAHLNQAAESIEKQPGKQAQVVASYENGTLAAVTVTFAEPPAVAVDELGRIARKAVIETFKAEPGELIISLVFAKEVSAISGIQEPACPDASGRPTPLCN
ncbi:hypothetical protein sS8_4148 [Methylocaldum marinum]|uniref:Lipoprotein n=1 Tax=Methylocaldum marinum TaxID=1432792 RepID=A0A250KWM3_9GAMM|nr:hypothetical protein [Methylocaldum marinum]BBA36078.1 hypothetical protein sS8_4148 [Methylocaldum marinum]